MSATPNKTIRPFTFDQSFDSLHEVDDKAEKPQEEEEVVPTFSEEELQAAREEAYKLGLEAGQQEIRSSLEQHIAATLEVIAGTLGRLGEQQQAANKRIARESVDIAVAAMRKLLPSTVERHGTAEIETLVKETLAKILDEPRVTIRVSDSIAADIEQQLGELAARIGYSGETRIVPDPELGFADCRVIWSDGEALRQVETILDDLGGLVSGLPKNEFEPEVLAPAPPPGLSDQTEHESADGSQPIDAAIDLEAEREDDATATATAEGEIPVDTVPEAEEPGEAAVFDDPQTPDETAADSDDERGRPPDPA